MTRHQTAYPFRRWLDPRSLARAMNEKPDLYDCLCSEAERRDQLPARRSTFSTLSTLLLWIVLAVSFGLIAGGVL